MLLLSLINLINNAALIYPYAPEKPLFFQSLGVHSCALTYCQHSHSSAACTPSPPKVHWFLLPIALFLMLFKFSTLSFPPLCVLEGDGLSPRPGAFPQSPFQSPLQTPQTILSCRAVTELSLSEAGVHPGSGQAWKGVGGKVRDLLFLHSPSVAQGQELSQKSRAVLSGEETSECAVPVWVRGLHLGRTEPPGSGGRKLLEQTRHECQGGNSGSEGLWAGAWMCQQGRWKTSANVDTAAPFNWQGKMRSIKSLWKSKQWKHFFCGFAFLAAFLNVRKQGAQLWRAGPSPGHGPEHWHSTELAAARVTELLCVCALALQGRGGLPPLLAEAACLSLGRRGGREGIFSPSPSMEMPEGLWSCVWTVRWDQGAKSARGWLCQRLHPGSGGCSVCEAPLALWEILGVEGTWLLAIVRKKRELSSRVFVEYFHCE